MFGNKKNKKYLAKLERKSIRFAAKQNKYKPTNVKVGDKFISPSGLTYTIIGEKYEAKDETGARRRTLKIETNFVPKPMLELPDTLFDTESLTKLPRKSKKR